MTFWVKYSGLPSLNSIQKQTNTTNALGRWGRDPTHGWDEGTLSRVKACSEAGGVQPVQCTHQLLWGALERQLGEAGDVRKGHGGVDVGARRELAVRQRGRAAVLEHLQQLRGDVGREQGPLSPPPNPPSPMQRPTHPPTQLLFGNCAK